ncbi:MAG: hypothetical protein HOA90_00070, partial [Prolixibacteraceae bacterium]|nr:hypothetical protein [Prolixibacteraceae bacterium]
MKKISFFVGLIVMSTTILLAQPKVELVAKTAEKKVDVLIDGKLFTSYIYPDNVKKPVLWPV